MEALDAVRKTSVDSWRVVFHYRGQIESDVQTMPEANEGRKAVTKLKPTWAHHEFTPWRKGKDGTIRLSGERQWKLVEYWNRQAERDYDVAQAQWVHDCCVGSKSYAEPQIEEFRRRVFVGCDVFEGEQDSAYDWRYTIYDWRGDLATLKIGTMERLMNLSDVRARLFRQIDACPNLDFVLVTEHPENVSKMWPTEDDGAGGRLANAIFGGKGRLVRRRHNVWLMVRVENQEQADDRIEALQEIASDDSTGQSDYCRVVGLYVDEPVEPIDFCDGFGACYHDAEDGDSVTGDVAYSNGIGFVSICDGEIKAVQSIVRQCREAEVPVWVDCADDIPEELRLRELPVPPEA
jgi:hypothetical protein